MKVIDLTIPKGAIFSDDGKYRYVLWRSWKANPIIRLQISLNPSSAGALNDDPTITRSMTRANQDGFGALIQENLSAFISTDPKIFLKEGCQIGAETNEYLKHAIVLTLMSGGQVVIAWGSFPGLTWRAAQVLRMIPEPYCLGVNADGQPKHPLYVSYKTPVKRYLIDTAHAKVAQVPPRSEWERAEPVY